MADVQNPPARFTCGTCGATFASKGEKRRHKLSGCLSRHNFDHSADDSDFCPAQDLYGRVQGVVTPEIKARANAEWAAMDDRGRLPEGWAYP